MARGWIGALVLIAALAFGAALVLDIGGLQSRLFAEGPERPPPPSPKLPAPAAAPKPVAPITPAWFIGSSGYEGAELERQAARASMMIYFQKRNCEACRRFEHEVLGSAEVKSFLADLVKVRVDADEEKKLAARFGVTSAPSIVVVPRQGTPRVIPEKALSSPHQLIAFSR